MQLLRFFHTAKVLMGPAIVEKSVLAKLRKSTGYSFSKCKEALQKHENDLKQAEHWLRAEAQAHGWEKATKLQGRSTAQGLVAILSNVSNTVILEVNCETDFVARNKRFQGLVQKITQGCHQFVEEQHSGAILTKLPLTGDEISNLPLQGQRPIKDEVALGIGEFGENIQPRRAVCLHTDGSIWFSGYTHPAPETPPLTQEIVQFGKYGAVVALRSTGSQGHKITESDKKALSLIGRQLCQHIVGMNPKEIGSLEVPEPEVVKNDTDIEPIPDSSSTEPDFSPRPEVDEEVLMNQDFLLDTDLTVREFLVQNSVEVMDFVRFECGENIEPTYCQ